jgi:hypothetical protein
MARDHQPDQAIFRSVLPEDIDWQPFPAFPPSVRLAIVVGEPSEPGPYVIRVKVPSGVKLMPHQHPEDRVYTVMSGVFYIGWEAVLTTNNCRPTPQAPSSCSPAVLPISTGQSLVRTSPRCRPSGRSVLNTSTRATTRGTSEIPSAVTAMQGDEEVTRGIVL